jgi:hypothetical protein
LPEQLTAIWTALFEFINDNRVDAHRLATAFAAHGEIPAGVNYMKKCRRNFEFLHQIIRKARAAGALGREFDGRDLTMGIWGMMSLRVMEHLVHPSRKLSRRDAAGIVRLVLEGAAPRRQ